MKTIKNTLGLLVVFLFIGLSAFAQGTAGLSGKVTNKDGAPLGLTSIVAENLKVGTLVQDDGTYFLVIPTHGELKGKNIEVTVSRTGYKSQTHKLSVDAGQVLTKDFVMDLDTAVFKDAVVTDFILPGLSSKSVWTNWNKDTVILDVKNSFYSSIKDLKTGKKVTHKGLYSLKGGKAAMLFIEGRAYAIVEGDKMKITFYGPDDKIEVTTELVRAK